VPVASGRQRLARATASLAHLFKGKHVGQISLNLLQDPPLTFTERNDALVVEAAFVAYAFEGEWRRVSRVRRKPLRECVELHDADGLGLGLAGTDDLPSARQ
jgi:hypothetical protein